MKYETNKLKIKSVYRITEYILIIAIYQPCNQVLKWKFINEENKNMYDIYANPLAESVISEISPQDA